ncbi:hypothetical protein BD410DRAFT_809057 [Rickenella mellea]|uniref:Ribonuclease H1 N-terminal domain-containing protein n=1 Tax=Rickenella mellea TaxID=50990 RepID=A0A4Y7PL63_9AGAM|nr:hypothetical protein BD410DRAFT_809057 [Rickenella mellea]
MVDLRHRAISQNDSSGDDGDGDEQSPYRPPVSSSGDDQPWLFTALVFILHALVGAIQAGFAALASTPLFLSTAFANTGQPARIQNVADPPAIPHYYAPPHHLGERWYAVYVGRRVGVFNEWADVAHSTSGISGNSQRRFGTRDDAIASFRAAHAAGHVRIQHFTPPAPYVPPSTTNEENAAQGPGPSSSRSKHYPDCGVGPKFKPFHKKEEPDDDGRC